MGPVCPEGAKPAVRLPFYSVLFRTLELDHTYYAIPKTANLEKMPITGGYNLTFFIKIYRRLVREINPSFTWHEVHSLKLHQKPPK
jgi:uncharacterized protein YecE (DUF72 family)